MTREYLEQLNPQQREAVEYCDGPQLVIAGAGSGKTRVLTYKIVHLLTQGYEPWRIMALTFTNKAAREMRDRIEALVGHDTARRLWMGTFHSIFSRILRQNAALIGFKPTFTIYDSADSKALIKQIIKDMNLDEKLYKPSTIQGVISMAKNALISPDAYAADPDLTAADHAARRPLTVDIYRTYRARCRVAGAMDFDDLLYYTNVLLKEHREVLAYYRDFFRYVLVDEYQDTNFAQHCIVTELCEKTNALTMVGDDAQSIYSFRGANIRNILDLETSFPGLETFKLERNYRSTQNIINAAGSLISKNRDQIPKNVYSENDLGRLIDVARCYSDYEEAAQVAGKVSQVKRASGGSYDEFAILYRTNAQSRVLEEALRKRNINYRIYGGLSFYQRKEIKDVIAYFRITINPDDDEALRRVINYPARGIGETTMKKIQAAASEAKVSLWSVIREPEKYKLAVNSGTQKKLDGFAELISLFIKDNETSNAYELGQLIYNRTGILTSLAHDNTPESISRQENLSEMLSGLKDFVEFREEEGIEEISMRDFLSEVMLATDQDESDDTNEPKVTLMTVHAAKGLEFKHVYIVGVEEELFPAAMSMDSLAQVEEERRLLYVAITRAKETCTLTFAGSRFRNGQTVLTKPSRFLSEIDPRFLKMVSSVNVDDSSERFINPAANFSSSFGGKSQYSSGDRGGYGTSSRYGSGGTGRYGAGNSASGRIGATDYGKRPEGDSRRLVSLRDGIAGAGKSIVPQHSIDEISVGTRIEHPKLGKGEVTAIGNIAGEPSITVEFEVVGTKKLLLKFAKFNILK